MIDVVFIHCFKEIQYATNLAPFTPPPPVLRLLVESLTAVRRSALLITIPVLLFMSAMFAPSSVFAATNSSPSPTPTPQVSMFQGKTFVMQTTPKEAAYVADKQKISNEYSNVLHGSESLSTYEAHYKAFMTKWNLGDSSKLHAILTGSNRHNKLAAISAAQLNSNATAMASYTYASQFPEEQSNYCGPATMAETLVEDSFSWSGANSYNGYTIQYDPYVISQPSGIASGNESYLAVNYLGIPAGTQYGTDPGTLLNSLNAFINGKGGQYAPVWSNANLQNNIVSDIATGWDVPIGIYVDAHIYPSLPGYPVFQNQLQHWIAATYDTNSTVYYADPTYKSPDFTPPTWTTPGPYASTDIGTLSQFVPFYLW